MLAYKYRGGSEQIFKRDIDSIQADLFWAPQICDLNDPCEALVEHDAFKPQLDSVLKVFGVQSDETVKSAFNDFYNRFDEVRLKIPQAGIFSLSNTYSHELLWAHYANSHKGFCIEYDTDILLRDKNLTG